MATKKEIRQALICRLIRNNDIPNQKTLRELLFINGINATQTTISRDMYELNIAKDRYSKEDIGYCRMPKEQVQDAWGAHPLLLSDVCIHKAI